MNICIQDFQILQIYLGLLYLIAKIRVAQRIFYIFKGILLHLKILKNQISRHIIRMEIGENFTSATT